MLQITNVHEKYEFLLALRIPLAVGEISWANGLVLISIPATLFFYTDHGFAGDLTTCILLNVL